MKIILATLTTSICLGVSSGAVAQMVTAPETEQICPDRPPEPELLENMTVREVHRKLLVQNMYYAYRSQLVVESGECTCENRFPSWEPVVKYYLENYARLEDRWDIDAAQEPYEDAKEAYREQLREICVAQNNWR